MTNSMAEIENTDCILITGSNTAESHPIIGRMVKRAVDRKRAKLIVIDPRKVELVKFAHIWLRPRPGTDVAWLNGLMHVILAEDLWDEKYVADRTEGFEELRAAVAEYTPEYVEQLTGIPAGDLRRAARMYAKAPRAMILYAMGITQHTTGTDNVKSLANLAMLCGNVGIEGGGVNPLRGQNNVQGSCDMGGLPNVLPGYQSVADENVLARFQQAWGTGVRLSGRPGLMMTEMFPAILAGEIKAMAVMGENPVLSDANVAHVREALQGLDFLVVQDIFFTETAQLADVVLPAASFAEKDGTFTNTERKVQLVRAAVPAPGEARPDWRIITDLARHMGADWHYGHPREIMAEIAALTPSYAGISFERLEGGGLCWPCPDESHPGTPILHIGRFTRGLGKFFPVAYQPPDEEPDEQYPLSLTTGRMLEHYHTGTMTRRSDGINELVPTGFAELHPSDAEALGVSDGATVTVETRRGRIDVGAYVTPRVRPGTVFIPFHFWESPANRLTNTARDPLAKIPEFKVCGCRIVA